MVMATVERAEVEGGAGEARTARVLGERVSFRVVGDLGAGLPVVYLHGLGSEGADLLPLAVEVHARAGAPGLVLDLPGFGASDRPARDYPVVRAAQVVLALMCQRGASRALWLGASYGGHVALRAALDAPTAVAGLVLVASGGLFRDPPRHLAAAFDARAMQARSLPAVAAAVDALVGDPNPATAVYRARRLASHAGVPLAPSADYDAVARSARGALEDDAGARLEQVAAPVALVHGARDPLVPVALAREAVLRLPRATLTVLDGVGHVPWLEAPALVATAAERLLADLEAERPLTR